MNQSVNGGAGEGLVGQGFDKIGNQADLVWDDVVRNQTQFSFAAGQHAVLFILHDGNGNIGAFRTRSAGGGNGNDVLLMLDGETLEVEIMHSVRTLAAQQLAQVHNRAAANSDHAVVAVIGNGVVHGLNHGLGRLPGAEFLLEHILAFEIQFLHKRGVDELVGEHHIPLIQLEFLCHSREGVEFVHRGGKNDLALVGHQSGGKSIHFLSHNFHSPLKYIIVILAGSAIPVPSNPLCGQSCHLQHFSSEHCHKACFLFMEHSPFPVSFTEVAAKRK
jgi:hypothetical protein